MGCKEDEGFTAALDAVQDYLALQSSLAEAMRAGFLSLAQARYSMGADRVSALQFPAHMRATAHLSVAEGGDLELVVGATAAGAEPPAAPSPSSTGSWAKAEAELPAAVTASAAGESGLTAAQGADASSCSSNSRGASAAVPSPGTAVAAAPSSGAAAGSGTVGVEEELQRLRLVAEQSDDIMQQLAAKYGCTGGSSSGSNPHLTGSSSGLAGEDDDDAEYAEVALAGRPLSWFGSLVAPSLREAEVHFASALALLVQAANAQRRLRRSMNGWQAAGTGGGVGVGEAATA